MDTKTLSQFIAWSKTTDLQEVLYSRAGQTVHIKTADAAPSAADFSSSLVPVKSPAVGVFCAGKKGKQTALQEGAPIKKGCLLGVIDMGKTSKEVLAPQSGVLKVIAAQDGQCAEYGSPLFFIEPK